MIISIWLVNDFTCSEYYQVTLCNFLEKYIDVDLFKSFNIKY